MLGVGAVCSRACCCDARTCAITTISKRGKPAAPGPASAFAQARSFYIFRIACDWHLLTSQAMAASSVHYMAACDEKDVKAARAQV